MLTWNGLEDTLACLASLEASAWPDLDLIVADNGSTDGTETAVRERHPAVSVIQNGRNVGFAAGNNAGIRLALARGADAFLVLNNDTWVPADAVERLVHALEADPFAGACSPVLSYAADPECLWFAGAPFDPARARAGRASSYERGSQLPDSPIAIDRAVGAAMLVRAEVAAAVGLFAEELFFLYEDVEWSLRMRAAGWRVLLVPDARLAHAVSASQGGTPHTPTTAYYGTRNDLEVGRRHSGLSGLRALRRELLCVAVHLYGARRAEASLRSGYLAEVIRGWRDYREGRLGPRRT